MRDKKSERLNAAAIVDVLKALKNPEIEKLANRIEVHLDNVLRVAQTTLNSKSYEFIRLNSAASSTANTIKEKNLYSPAASKMYSFFGHRTAKQTNKKIFESIYVFGKNDTKEAVAIDDLTNEYCLNESPAKLKAFLQHVSDKAYKSTLDFKLKEGATDASLDDRQNDAYANRFVFVAPKGSGKTFLLNYIISVNSALLDRLNSIWIRVDLTKPFKTWSVQDRFFHQVVKVVKEQYLVSASSNEKRPKLTEAEFNKFLTHKYDKKRSSALQTKLSNVKEIPDAIHDKPDLLEGYLPGADLFFEVQSFCIDKGYTFIYVLDGLDAIHPDDYHDEMFNGWLDQANSLFWYDKDRYVGAWILVMRDESYLEFNKRFVMPENSRPEPRKIRLSKVSPNKVYQKRMVAFKESMDEDAGVEIKKLSDLLIEFVAGGLKVGPEEALPLLLAHFSDDMRQLLRFLQLCLLRMLYAFENDLGLHKATEKSDILQTKLLVNHKLKTILNTDAARADFVKWKCYEVVETLVLGSDATRNNPFKYDVDLSKDKRKNLNVSRNPYFGKYSGFTVNIFNFSDLIVDDGELDPITHLYFFKILILMILSEQKKDTNIARKTLSERALIRRLQSCVEGSDLHSYPLIRAHIHELMYASAIEVVDDNESGKLIKISDAGEYFFNNLLYDHTYLMNLVENIPLPSSLADVFNAHEPDSTVKPRVLAIKIKNLLSFIECLKLYASESKIERKDSLVMLINDLSISVNKGISRIIVAAYTKKTQERFRDAFMTIFDSENV